MSVAVVRSAPLPETPPQESAASATSNSGPAPKRAYPPAAETPTQSAPEGVRFDFNDGCRVLLPEGEHPWRVRLSDLDTGNTLFETQINAGRVNSTKRYYLRIRLEIFSLGKVLLTQ